MFSDAEKKLLSSILEQVNIGQIDWDKVAKDVNVPTKSAAQMRWTRFKKTLPSNGNVTASPPATPKKRQSPMKSKAPKGSAKKKQKRSKSGIDTDDEDEEAQFENDDKEENKKITPETPARSLPSRKAKTRTPIKEALTSDEEEEEEDEIKFDIKDKEQIENGETRGTEYTEETMASGRNEVDSGSDFDGDMEA